MSKDEADSNFSYKAKAVAFPAFAGWFGMLAEFGGALSQVKKQDPGHFDKGMTGRSCRGSRKDRYHEKNGQCSHGENKKCQSCA